MNPYEIRDPRCWLPGLTIILISTVMTIVAWTIAGMIIAWKWLRGQRRGYVVNDITGMIWRYPLPHWCGYWSDW